MGKPEKVIIRCTPDFKSRWYSHAALHENNETFAEALLDEWESREETTRPVTA